MKKLIPAVALLVFAGALSAQTAEVAVSGGVSAMSNKCWAACRVRRRPETTFLSTTVFGWHSGLR